MDGQDCAFPSHAHAVDACCKTMADTIEQLKDKLQALEADSGGNKDRKKLEVALELCAALAALDMKRGVVQYADLAIDLDGDCVPAIVFELKRCKPWPSSGLHRKPRQRRRRRAPRAWPRATAASRSRGSRATERGSRVCGALCRRRLRKRRRRSPERSRRRSLKMLSWIYLKREPRKVAVTTADVRSAGGAPLRQSDWNKKDTSVSGAERAPSTYRIDGVPVGYLHAIDAYATQVGGARRDVVGY